MRKAFALYMVISGLFFSNNYLLSDTVEKSLRYSKNIIYLESAGSGFLDNYNFSLNYERMIAREIGIRAGLGIGRFSNSATLGKSAVIMLNFLTTSLHKFELGLGVNYTFILAEEIPDISPDISTDVVTSVGISHNEFSPCISIGYRYQKNEAGIFFRVGFTWVYNFGGPFQLSIGYVF
ncbi:hypothetical protein ACFLSQ_06965 [Bacteroidota bacterium]